MKKKINSLPTRKGQWVQVRGNKQNPIILQKTGGSGKDKRIGETTNRIKAESKPNLDTMEELIPKQIAYFKMQVLSVHTQHTLLLSLLS